MSRGLDEREIRSRVEPLLRALYDELGHDTALLCDRFVGIVRDRRGSRPEALKELDEKTAPDWFNAADRIAYALYADLFCPEAPEGHKLSALSHETAYFEELGVNLIHILPILKSSGDGGFAVDDYGQVDAKFGTTDVFRRLIAEFHRHGLRVAHDFVLNHVSDNHAWARAAADRDPHYFDFFLWSETGEPWPEVLEIFPEFSPGHWDYVEKVGRYVWSTFYKRRPRGSEKEQFDFSQWDLNYRNPDVLLEMLDSLLQMANWGVDVFRLDAVPFLWKERGTRCESLPPVHNILKVFRLGLQCVAPGAVLLAEANQAYEKLVDYFGDGDEVQIAYHFTLMPALWQAVTTGRAQNIREVLERADGVSDRCHWWVTSEVHDDVGLESADEATARELSEYFVAGGGLPFRKSRDENFPRAISGTTCTLLRRDFRRILMLWFLKLSLGWTPLFFMGEELGVENDLSYRDDPTRRNDNRFVKRVALSEERKRRRNAPGSHESFLYYNLRRLIAWRKEHPCLVKPSVFHETGSPSVLGFSKQDEEEHLMILANCSETVQKVKVPVVGWVTLKPFEYWWESRKPGF